MKIADNTALYKSINRQVAGRHGPRATFMPKPFTDAAGNGIHVHSNLNQEGNNLFADSAHAPNELMRHWIGGPLEHASPISSISSFGAPTPNGPRRIQAYTFAPTHVCWGLDNRTVLARCIAEPSSAANRAEFRSAGEDANPYLIIAATLAAGCDGIERKVGPMPMSVGDMYSRPGDATALPASLANILALYQHGALTQMLDNTFSRSFTSIAAAEIALVQTQESAKDEVSDKCRHTARGVRHPQPSANIHLNRSAKHP